MKFLVEIVKTQSKSRAREQERAQGRLGVRCKERGARSSNGGPHGRSATALTGRRERGRERRTGGEKVEAEMNGGVEVDTER